MAGVFQSLKDEGDKFGNVAFNIVVHFSSRKIPPFEVVFQCHSEAIAEESDRRQQVVPGPDQGWAKDYFHRLDKISRSKKIVNKPSFNKFLFYIEQNKWMEKGIVFLVL